MVQRLNALGAGVAKKGDNCRVAISAETKNFDGNLPKFPKSPRESALIMDCLRANTFMKTLQKDQLQNVSKKYFGVDGHEVHIPQN